MGIFQIKFLIGRPSISFIENFSQLQTRKYENVFSAISFISIIGMEDGKVDLNEQNQ